MGSTAAERIIDPDAAHDKRQMQYPAGCPSTNATRTLSS